MTYAYLYPTERDTKAPQPTAAGLLCSQVISAEPNLLVIVDDSGTTRAFYGIPYSLVTWPSNQQQLFGER